MATQQSQSEVQPHETRSTALATNPSATAPDASTSKRLATHAKSYVADEVKHRRTKSSNDFSMLAKALRLTSQQLEGNIASPYLDKIAGQVERVSGFLGKADVRDLARATSDLARREPLLFAGGMFVLGLGGARFLKSTGGVAAETHTKRQSEVGK